MAQLDDTEAGMGGITSDPTQAAGPQSDDSMQESRTKATTAPEKEKLVAKKNFDDYEKARKFDSAFRKQIAQDRRYAAGTSELSWAVTTNLIGAYIDILVALIYARDPDVSCRKSPQVDEENTQQRDVFAKTMEIVISHLWMKGKLKKAARKGVRSVLSNAEGWLKCTMVSEAKPNSEVETALNDTKETHARLAAQEAQLAEDTGMDSLTRQALLNDVQELKAELMEKTEMTVNKMFVIDFIQTENMQISTDVTSISDHTDADWNANEMFVSVEDARERFPDLTEDDWKQAKRYYMRAPSGMNSQDKDGVFPQGQLTAESAQTFTTNQPGTEDSSPAFLRVIEQWKRTDKQVYTMIEGVQRWVKQPYAPPYPTERFYPYFYFCFYEVDGLRHPQSLAWRLYKLQDEYSSVRSSFRLSRQRAKPGIFVNGTMIEAADMEKVRASVEQEYMVLNPPNSEVPLANAFAAKPVAAIDMRLYDTTIIVSDMQVVSGVQEALSAATQQSGNPITATEASIEQSGTAARTGSDRDALESMLNELAVYTAQQALQCLTRLDVQRLAGPKAFWPEGMDVDDLFTLVEVAIKAGTTGKPKTQTDQQAWAQILPLIQQMLKEIEMSMAGGNLPMAQALIELVKETMHRMGDESDPDRFIPKIPPPGSPGAGAPPKPPAPQISVSLKGEISPDAAAALIAPTVAADQAVMQPPPPAPGAPPSPGQASPPAPVGSAPGAGSIPPHP